jgi:acyl carrier protein
MARVIDDIDAARPLRGVVHSAGALNDGVLIGQRWAEAETVLRGKLLGAWTLHRLTRGLNLDFFVLYSAAGARGQGLYPAANAALDALAQYRRRLGLPALSVAWGRWGGVGMAARAAARDADAWSDRGLKPIDPHVGFAAMARLLAQHARHGIVLPIDWQRFLATLPEGMDRDFFSRVGRHAIPPRPAARDASSAAHADAAAAPGAKRLHELPTTQRRAALLALLRERTLAVIGLDPALAIDPRQPLKDLGLDSLMAVELRNVLIREGGRRLPTTLLFDYSSLDALAGHLMTVWDLAAAEPTRSNGASRDDPSNVSVMTEVSAMSESQAEALLLAELSGGGA